MKWRRERERKRLFASVIFNQLLLSSQKTLIKEDLSKTCNGTQVSLSFVCLLKAVVTHVYHKDSPVLYKV